MQAVVRAQPAARLQATRPAGRVFQPVQAAVSSKEKTQGRHRRLRKKLAGDAERPRLAVFRSNEHIYAQVIDDVKGHTLASASTMLKDINAACEGKGNTTAGAVAVGKKIAEVCKASGIEKVAFDRGGFAYHGRVQALADAAREGGLEF